MRPAPAALLVVMASLPGCRSYSTCASRGPQMQRHAARVLAPAMLASEDSQDADDSRGLAGRSQLEDRSEPADRSDVAGLASPGPMAVGALLLLFTTNQWARSLIFYLVDFKAAPGDAAFEFMNVDIGFGEAQYGVLASIGFAALFSVASIAAGSLVERFDARTLLASTAVLWSGATVWQGFSHSFEEVLASRMLSGIGQAFSNPASYTILSRVYPKDRLASVNGVYASGLYFGGGLAALSILIDQALGWRALSIGVGAVGLAGAAAVVATLPPCPPETPPPPRLAAGAIERSDTAPSKSAGSAVSTSDDDEASALLDAPSDERTPSASVGAELARLLGEPTVQLLLVASALRFLAGFTIGVWIVPFYRQAYVAPLHHTQAHAGTRSHAQPRAATRSNAQPRAATRSHTQPHAATRSHTQT
jgi:MFS family permease